MRRMLRGAMVWLGFARPRETGGQPRLSIRSVRCPVCRGVQPVTRDGTVATHPGEVTRYDLGAVKCAGSGRVVIAG